MEIHNGLPFQSEEEKNMDKVIELWNNYCITNTNIIHERCKFQYQAQYSAGESIDTWATAVRKALKEELFRDRVVCGIYDNAHALQKKILQEASLIFEKRLNICCRSS